MQSSTHIQFTVSEGLAIVASAALLRFVLYPVYRLYFAFPWDQGVYAGFLSICFVTSLRIAPRPGSTILWTATWTLLDYVFQGGALPYLLGYAPIPVLTELTFWLMGRWGQDLPSALIGAVVYQMGHSTWTWIAYNEIWLIPPYPLATFATVGPVAVLLAAPIGAAVGFALGGLLLRLLALRVKRFRPGLS